MALCYKKLWKLLIDHDMNRADLRGETGIDPATIAKMSRGESVGASVLERICESLQCNIGDIVDYVPNESGSGQIAKAKMNEELRALGEEARRLEGEILGDGKRIFK